jgi:hypothetical protein
MIALADVTDSKRWWVEGGATSSHHSGSKWGQLRLAHSGLMEGDRRGTWIYYRVLPQALEAASAALRPGRVSV